MNDYSAVGKSVPRIDGIAKVTGKAVYGVDVKLPNMLHGKVLRSPHAHARIVHIDVSRAAALKGVKAILTAQDTPKYKFGFFLHKNPSFADKLPLESEKVRYIGDEVAAVAAVAEDAAEEALQFVRVEYEPLPAVFEPEQALMSGAPRIHESCTNNVITTIRFKGGDIQKGFEQADVVIQDRFRTPGVAPSCMEPHQAVVDFSSSKNLTIWSSTQMPFFLKRDLAEAVGLSDAQVRVITTTMGGGFGSRMEMHPLDPIAALLSRKSGRPVRIVNSREEEFIASRFRHPMIFDIRLGAKKDGTLVAIQSDAILDSGAYCSQAPGVLGVAGSNSLSLYYIPNFSFVGKAVYTNNPYAGAFRCYGKPQSIFALESMVDMIAERLNIDPFEIRILNGRRSGQTGVLGDRVTSCGFSECISKSREALEKAGKLEDNMGIGVASFYHPGGGSRVHGNSDGCGAFIKMDDDGTVTLLTGSQELGQGSSTVFAQIVAEVLGIDWHDVRVESNDTAVIPWDVGAHGSRSTFIGGNAARLAALDAKDQIKKFAGDFLEADADDLEFRQGKILVRGSPGRAISLGEVVKQLHYRDKGTVIFGRAFYDPPTEEPDSNGYGNKSATYSFGAQVVVLKVDTETGKVFVQKVISANDLGKPINPMSCEGQLQGAIVQGIGFAVTEQLIWEKGRTQNPNFMDYRIPRACDIPEIEVMFAETEDPEGPFGAKGIGEPGIIPTAPAIANAIYHAIGIRIKELPITPEKILQALKEKRSERN